MKILFVDDDNEFLDILKETFKDCADGTYVYTGGDGLEQLKHKRFDVVVLDLMMFLDGVTFVKLANGRLRDARVYFLSCLETEEVENKVSSIKERIAGIFGKHDIESLKREILKEPVLG